MVKIKFGLSLLILFFSWSGFCAQVLLDVTLSPVGSFEIRSESIGGKLTYMDSEKRYLTKRLFVRSGELTSGIELRDQHIHKFFKSDDFPYIELKNVEAKNGRGTGELHVAGQKQKIEFTYSIKDDLLLAEFDLNLDDLKFEVPSFMGIRPKKEIGVKVYYELSRVLRLK